MYKDHELNIENRAKWYECYVSINEVVHRIYYKTTVDGMFHLYVDDKCITSQKNWIVKLQGFDYALEIDGETIRCVFYEKQLDIAMYGRYIKCQKNYIPNKVLRRYNTTAISLCAIQISFSFAWIYGKVTREVMWTVLIVWFVGLLGISMYYDIYNKKAKKEQKLKENTYDKF